MQKEWIIEKLRDQGCRITKQRLLLIDIILENECSSCKDIYYKALKQDSKIGPATVYRMINTLEEIGAINRKNMYKIEDDTLKDDSIFTNIDMKSLDSTEEETINSSNQMITIQLMDQTTVHLSKGKWIQVIMEGLRVCGYPIPSSSQNTDNQ